MNNLSQYFEINEKDDEVILDYINNDKELKNCNDLISFIKRNNLPLIEKWFFYYLGKTNAFEDFNLKKNIKIYSDYGIYYSPYMYCWNEFLSGSNKHIEYELGFVIENNKYTKYNDLRRLIIIATWEYIEQRVIDREKNIEIRDSMNHRKELEENDFFEESYYCEACQSDPCMCSDPDPG